MDIITYALLKKQVNAVQTKVTELEDDVDHVTLAYDYKGSVSSVGNLPSGATKGDMYTVDGDEYVWDGSAWVLVGQSIKNSQIDVLFN